MERRASAYFKVIRIDRWTLALILMVVLGILLIPARGLLPVMGGPGGTVKNGVTLRNGDFSGKNEPEARSMLADMAQAVESQPVAATEARDAKGVTYVIPELNGYSMDIDQTWYRLQTAAAGARVEPVIKAQPPDKRLSDFPRTVIKKGNSNKPAVGLLINVDWGEMELSAMLPILKKQGARVTFFVSGRWADGHKKLLEQIAADGHEVASHGYNLSSGPSELAKAGKLREDIQRSVRSIEQITGKQVRYYAPHKSEIDPLILQTAAEMKLQTVLYSVDTVDWDTSISSAKILSTLGTAKAGDLVLMHPMPNTVRALDQALQQFRSRGLTPMTLSEIISPEGYSMTDVFSGGHE